MKFAFTAFMIGAMVANVQGNHPKVQAPVETFSHKYFAELDKANTALETYANTPCLAPEFKGAAEAFLAEAKYLDGMHKNIPLDEDDITRAHEKEAFIGFVMLANEIVDAQNACLDPKKDTQ